MKGTSGCLNTPDALGSSPDACVLGEELPPQDVNVQQNAKAQAMLIPISRIDFVRIEDVLRRLPVRATLEGSSFIYLYDPPVFRSARLQMDGAVSRNSVNVVYQFFGLH